MNIFFNESGEFIGFSKQLGFTKPSEKEPLGELDFFETIEENNSLIQKIKKRNRNKFNNLARRKRAFFFVCVFL